MPRNDFVWQRTSSIRSAVQQQILRFAQEDTVLSDQLFMSRSRSRFTLDESLDDEPRFEEPAC